MRGVEQPAKRAEAIKSRSRKLSVSARTSLVTPIQDVSPITTMIFARLGSKKAITAKIRKNDGKQSMTSTRRIIVSSTYFLKYPLTRPRNVPMEMEIPTATNPTHNEILPP